MNSFHLIGYGNVYGEEQSGAATLGLDLQAQILAQEIASIRKQFILSGEYFFSVVVSSFLLISSVFFSP